ncbi:MAG: hypothetical protein ACWGIK_16710 [Achromobacter pulmonis]
MNTVVDVHHNFKCGMAGNTAPQVGRVGIVLLVKRRIYQTVR